MDAEALGRFAEASAVLTQYPHDEPLFVAMRVLVVGDLMLDQFVWGRVRRISPEAPVPVVQLTREELRPGGAGNVASNIAALGGRGLPSLRR